MTGRRFVHSCLGPIVVLATIGLTATPGAADAPRDQGWWTVTNPIPAAPDVPPRGLLIQGGGDRPTAFAALLYELAPGTTAGSLTLTIAPNTATTPSATLLVCPLLQAIAHPDQGGPMSNAPPYDCSRKVTATPEANSYKFDASTLVTDTLVAVAILPNDPVGRVVLAAPDENSLSSTVGASADAVTPGAESNAAVSPSESATTPAAAPPGSLGTGGSADVGVSLPGVSPPGPSSVAPATAATPTRPSTAGGAFIPTVSAASENAVPVLVVLFAVSTLGAALLWLYAGRQGDGAVFSAP